MKTKLLKFSLSFILLLSVLFTTSIASEASAATVKNGVVDIRSGSLQVRDGASSKAKVVGSLKRSDNVKVYSTQNGWHEIRYNNKKAFVSADYVRFYHTTSLYSVKLIHDKVWGVEQSTIYKDLTKQQFYKAMSPAFTTDYINQYFKVEMMSFRKDSKGNPLYRVKGTDYRTFILTPFDWYLKNQDKKPTHVFYTKNNVQYIEITQYFKRDGLQQPLWYTIYLKKEPNSTWKVYSNYKKWE
ncbi:SH3 domain-containing protein [Bacillus massiliigorillae]|uniref:SH3 domain-containing protein n=1 Tax=Bacillus massiliigorillae TaxID=1243664 RepID=UPI00039CA0A6|nr:SH3 domain-containing protein [Bacillus massiliigorillae]